MYVALRFVSAIDDMADLGLEKGEERHVIVVFVSEKGIRRPARLRRRSCRFCGGVKSEFDSQQRSMFSAKR